MAHLPHTATRRPAGIAIRRHTRLERTRSGRVASTRPAAVTVTLEEELLARLDVWMADHPTAANVLAGVSVVALILVIIYAVVASSI